MFKDLSLQVNEPWVVPHWLYGSAIKGGRFAPPSSHMGGGWLMWITMLDQADQNWIKAEQFSSPPIPTARYALQNEFGCYTGMLHSVILDKNSWSGHHCLVFELEMDWRC